jgi:predicted permease
METTELGLLRRALRVLLRAYPDNFRDKYGEDLENTYVDRLTAFRRNGRRFALTRVLGVALWHSLRDGVAERITGRRRKGRLPMEGLTTDIHMALRGLRRDPGFTLVAVLILALGVGANVTAFTALKTAAFARPPFPDADRLVSVDLTRQGEQGERYSRWAYPYLDMLNDWDDRLIEPIAAYRTRQVTLTELGPASQVPIEMVSADYFSVVRLPLTLGRDFDAAEGESGSRQRVVIVSHSFWRTRLGGDQAALGREIRLNDAAFRVIGVAAPGFSGLAGGADMWLPHGAYDVVQPGVLQQAGNHVAWVIGRLRAGATLPAAAAQMQVIGEAVAEAWPRPDTYGAGVRSITEMWTNPAARTASTLLSLAAGLVLFVACANLSGLMLTRARRKIREGAVRRALGASRWRLIRSSLIESLTVATLGGLAGVTVSVWGTRLLILAWPSEFLHGTDTGLQVVNPNAISLDFGVMAFAILLSIIAALLIGLAPALRASSEQITGHLKDGAGVSGRRSSLAGIDAQTVLVGAQVSLALTLVVGVGLLGSSVKRLVGVEEGFRTERLITFDYTRPQAVPRLDASDENVWRDHITMSAQFDDRLKQRITALPGIEGMAVSASPMMGGFQAVLGVTGIEGQPDLEINRSIGVVPVDEECFETLGIPILSGRGFNTSDGLQSQPVVVLNETAVSIFFRDQDPIGQRIGIEFTLPGRRMAEVVGVVGDLLHTGPDQERWPVAYFSTRERRFGSHAMVRTSGDPTAAIRMIQNEIHDMDATVAMSDIATMDQLIRRSVGDRTMILAMLSVFASITVLLVAVGTWGVVAYSVANRTRELVLRMALGAERFNVVRLVIGKTTAIALLGVMLGLGGAFAGTRILSAFLWDTNAHDPMTFLAAGTFLFAVVSVASYLPARRATRVDPAQVLRAVE